MTPAAQLIDTAPDLELDYSDVAWCFEFEPQEATGTIAAIERTLRENARKGGWVRI